ncbi:MAG: hypothetical protein ACREJO_01275 [Phycisphaerales bacterium]
MPALLAANLLAFAATLADGAVPHADDETTAVKLVSEQLLVLGTIVAAIAALPALIEFLLETRKRRERIALSIEDEAVAEIRVNLAGMDDILADMEDLIDRARRPRAYSQLNVGNEILIVGPALLGKKALARRIAQLANLNRIITVYNPRNPDALAKAKSMVRKLGDERAMLLIPRVDSVFDAEDEEVEAELDALIETSSVLHNVLVVGTANSFEPDSDTDNLFGIKIVLPGTPTHTSRPCTSDARLVKLLTDVCAFYRQRAFASGSVLVGMDETEATRRVLAAANNPAEVEDIFEVARTAALHRQLTGGAQRVEITPEILDKAIRRVVPPAASAPAASA